MKRLIVTPHRCTGCRTCEVSCAFSHRKGEEPGLSRIITYMVKAPDQGVQVVCLQCQEAACVKVCPAFALWRNTSTGAIEWKKDRCIGCLSCTLACPFGNIHHDPRRGEIYKCDLCGGDPACARFCPTRALEFVDPAGALEDEDAA